MEQHPVPQHIASYEFRLIGDMTLKQFAQLAAGAILGLFVYALPMPAVFKWPLIIFFGFLGFAFGFLPINERPLSTWLISFFKAAFAPTQFIWAKKPQKMEIFEPILAKPMITGGGKFTTDKQTLNQYLATLPYAENKNQFDQQEESSLKEISNLFQLAHPIVAPIPSQPGPTFQPISQPPFKEPFVVKTSKQPSFKPKPVVLPQRPGRPRKTAVEAKINPELLIPAPPTQSNIMVGMVLDSEGKIVEGAILEIRNPQGLPVRALKTNKLGQFLIVTPLENGLYEIETEKEGLKFDIIKIEAKGAIIQPIEIRAKT
jgi:hypothetical protein